ncbi:class I SAM-dependent methyltransferase [Thiothrix nivea]|uniref:Methyltransferase type 12 n=1 Tax=Thiothrix nivea (strain ATCC 35100 / DSM 5205 / JP2) TaxID=870187 RepID=A0A656HJC6_THINJ|nr:class I SAM-dependent methyltransferase [Thiothrix nivea]EIJ35105.1 Methyltransferase type 12 [Thiothrix nivea DSM 5205]
MQNERVVWYEPQPATTDACTVCGNTQHNHLVLQVAHWVKDMGMMQVALCGACGSAWFPDMERYLVPYPDQNIILQDPDFPYYIYHYLEMVGGLDWKVSLLERLPFTGFQSVLEIGCNAGVMLDYCRTMWDATTVIGLEPSAYGVMGGKLLEIPIQSHYLRDAPEVQGRRFDFIYATEVLEHVQQPLEFLQELRQYLTDNGVVMLTTPRAGALNTQTPPGELLAALSPGAHYFLLSPEKLADLAQQAGFSWHHIEPFGMTQMAVLSRQPVALRPWFDVKERIREYYQRKTRLAVQDARVQLGHWINYHTHTAQADIPVEENVVLAIKSRLRHLFGIDLQQPQALLEQVLAADSLVGMGKAMPYALPFYLYWQARQLPDSDPRVWQYLQLAEICALQGLKVDFRNLFVYHALVMQIEKVLPVRPVPQPDHAWPLLARQIRESVPELQTPSPPVVSSVLGQIKSRLKRVGSRWMRV